MILARLGRKIKVAYVNRSSPGENIRSPPRALLRRMRVGGPHSRACSASQHTTSFSGNANIRIVGHRKLAVGRRVFDESERVLESCGGRSVKWLLPLLSLRNIRRASGLRFIPSAEYDQNDYVVRTCRRCIGSHRHPFDLIQIPVRLPRWLLVRV